MSPRRVSKHPKTSKNSTVTPPSEPKAGQEVYLFVKSPVASPMGSAHDSSSEVTANLFRKGGPMSGSVSPARRDSPRSADSNTSREHKNSHSDHKTSQSSVLQSTRSTISISEEPSPTVPQSTSKQTKDNASESLDSALTRFAKEIDAFAAVPTIQPVSAPSISESAAVELPNPAEPLLEPKIPLPLLAEDAEHSTVHKIDELKGDDSSAQVEMDLPVPKKFEIELPASKALETPSLTVSADAQTKGEPTEVGEIVFKAAVESFEILHMRQHLTNPRGLYYFQECLREHFAVENLHFWKAVQDLHQVSESSVLSETRAIFDSFFSPASNSEINISYIKKQKIVKRANANDWSRDMYDDISGDCFKVMTHYWIPHYRPEASSSIYYKNFLLERMGQPTLPMPVIKPPGQF